MIGYFPNREGWLSDEKTWEKGDEKHASGNEIDFVIFNISPLTHVHIVTTNPNNGTT